MLLMPLSSCFAPLLRHPSILILTITHLSVSVYYRLFGGLGITNHPMSDTWDWFWQTAPMAYLRAEPFKTIFYFHAQPPLFNALGAILGRLFYPTHLEALYTLNIVLGTLIVFMSGYIMLQLIPNTVFRNLVLFFIVFYPSLFLYEAYILYTHLTAFLVMLCIFWIAVYQKKKQVRFIYLFVLSLNLTVLTRSFFHPIIIVITLLALPLWITIHRRQIVLVSASISLLTVVFLIKNLVLFGFFGLTSWTGMNLFHIVSRGYEISELEALAEDGIIDRMVVEQPPFSSPAAYQQYGYTQTSDILILEYFTHNNINYIAVARRYGENAIALIRHDPKTYLEMVRWAYFDYIAPSAHFKDVKHNAEAMGHHEKIYNGVVYATIDQHGEAFPIHAISIPVLLFLYFVYFLWQTRFSLERLVGFFRQDKLMTVIFGFVVYSIVVGTFFEFGENHRFKYLTEIPLILFMTTMIYRMLIAIQILWSLCRTAMCRLWSAIHDHQRWGEKMAG